MGYYETVPKSSKTGLPVRYAGLVARLSGIVTRNADFSNVFARIEAQRLLAEGELRDSLADCWANRLDKDFSTLCLADILRPFLVYAKRVYCAVGQEFVALCQTEHGYLSLLSSAKAWLVSQIVPRQSVPKIDEEGIIRFNETVGSFRERLGEKEYAVFPHRNLGGDWEQLLDHTMSDAIRLREDCLDSGSLYPFFFALRRKANRDDAEEFLDVGLSREDTRLLAVWWKSRDQSVNNPSTSRRGYRLETRESKPDESRGKHTGPEGDGGTGVGTIPRFPNRAEWLRRKLAEREWNKHDLQRNLGPEHRTTQKILNGFKVQEDVLWKVIRGLQSKLEHKGRALPPVAQSNIPNN